jgi:hypothetical protein
VSKLRVVWLSLLASVCSCVVAVSAQVSVQTQSTPDSPALVQRPDDITPGKLVQSPHGEAIGTVRSLVPGSNNGSPDYVLVATRSGTAAIPYWAVVHLLRDAHLVIDRSLLEDAPRVSDDQVSNGADSTWKEQANSYWSSFR